MKRLATSALIIFVAIFTASAIAAEGISFYTDPIAPVIFGVTAMLFFALLGRFSARGLGQPSVLGEVIIGIIIGNLLHYFGVDLITVLREGPSVFQMFELAMSNQNWQAAASLSNDNHLQEVIDILSGPNGAEMLQVAHTVDIFSRYGVIFLLFIVGLDTSFEEMRAVGGDSLRVASIGVIVPFVAGFLMARLLMPEASINVDLFIAATLGATSVGITASVLQDLNQTNSNVARTILGAAVIDDILGLIMLAIISGIVVSGSVEINSIASVIALSILFLVSAFLIGPYFLHVTAQLLQRFNLIEAQLFIVFFFVMMLAWFANLVGLATIVGAFAAGLIMNDSYFKHWDNRQGMSIKELFKPLEVMLVPIFFVLMGIQVKLNAFLDWQVLTIAAGLLLAAIAGKIASGLGVLKGKNKLAVGIGMMPRGEVGLIFASIGKSLGIINDALFSSIVLVVIITTLATPPLLKWSLKDQTA